MGSAVVVPRVVFSLTLLQLLATRCLHSGLVLLCLCHHSSTNCIVIAGVLLLCHLTSSSHILLKLRLAKASFFYLGNSNSLATIDVGSCYTGITTFNPVLVSFQMVVHTFTGPLLVSHVLLAESVGDFVSVFLLVGSAELLVFHLLCICLRYHLFVWTVFSPKLLYNGMYLLVITLLCTFTAVIK